MPTPTFKPQDYNSLSPYYVVEGAEVYMQWLENVFAAERLRRYEGPDGRIVHAEMRIDDSVIMLAEATDEYPPNGMLTHVYVADVDAIYHRALASGCTAMGEPRTRPGDPDRRGSFKDRAGHIWTIATQLS